MSEGRRSKSFAGTAVWLNLLCLDAPLVAVSWQWLFARSFGIPVSARGTWALFLTAWLIYLADRFGDSLSLDPRGMRSLRQRFCQQHRRAWIVAMVTIALADVLLICTLNSSIWLAGAAVGALAVLYLTLNQVKPSFWHIVPMKEVAIGFLFAAGTMVPLIDGLTSELLLPWLLFGCLCSLNCISIAAWERPLDLAQRRVSIATTFPGVATCLLPSLALLCLTSGSFAAAGTRGASVYVGVCFSGVALAAVHLLRDQLPPDTRTALADLALLLPAMLLLLV